VFIFTFHCHTGQDRQAMQRRNREASLRRIKSQCMFDCFSLYITFYLHILVVPCDIVVSQTRENDCRKCVGSVLVIPTTSTRRECKSKGTRNVYTDKWIINVFTKKWTRNLASFKCTNF